MESIFNDKKYKNITIADKDGEPVAIILANGEAILRKGFDLIVNAGEDDE